MERFAHIREVLGRGVSLSAYDSRIQAAFKRHFPAMPPDYSWALLALDVGLPSFLLMASILDFGDTGNLVFGWNYMGLDVLRLLWCIALYVPSVLRRLAPDAAARAFAVVLVLHIVFGPASSHLWLCGFAIIYTTLVYGKHSPPRLIVPTAVILTALASATSTISERICPHIAPGTPANLVERISECAAIGDASSSSSPGGGIALNLLIAELVAVICIIGGLWRRTNRASMELLRSQAEILSASQAQARQAVAARERARIARDMHDVVAHTLSTVIVQADAGRLICATDIGRARGVMGTIRRELEHARRDMAQLLGVFNDAVGETGAQAGGRAADGSALTHAGYEAIGELIDEANQTPGLLHVTASVTGDPHPGRLQPSASICAYRVVEEALSNVRKHACGASKNADAASSPARPVNATVTCAWEAKGLRIEVVDDGAGHVGGGDDTSPGFGLMGMEERVTSAGGTMEAGPRASLAADGDVAAAGVEGSPPGWVVRVFLPFDDDPDSGTPGVQPASRQDAGEGDAGRTRRIPWRLPRPLTVTRRVPPARVDAAVSPREHVAQPQGSSPHATGRVAVIDCLIALAAMAIKFILCANIVSSIATPAFLRISFVNHPFLFVATMIVPCLPLCVRRARPQLCAYLTIALAVTDCLCAGLFSVGDAVPVCIAVFTGAMRSRHGVGRWLVLCSVAASVLFGLGFALIDMGASAVWLAGADPGVAVEYYSAYFLTPLQVLSRPDSISLYFELITTVPDSDYYLADLVYIGGTATCVALGLCLISAGFGFYVRSREDNRAVRQTHLDSLRAEVAARNAAAAEQERAMIAQRIQHEVTDTLDAVTRLADEGIVVLDSSEVTPAQGAASFRAISQEGRSALRRMRELLRVLRAPRDAPTANASAIAFPSEHDLRPAAPLAEQLAEAQAAPPPQGALSSELSPEREPPAEE